MNVWSICVLFLVTITNIWTKFGTKLKHNTVKRVHNLPSDLSYISALPYIAQKLTTYVVFLSIVWVALKRIDLASKWLWNEPVVWLDHSRCSKWRPFASSTHARSHVWHWSMASSMMPWGIRSHMSMLQLINVAFQFLCNVR